MSTEQHPTIGGKAPRKITNPKDGRLKESRDFRRFLLRAVYEPQLHGTFRNDPTARVNAAADCEMRTEALSSLSDQQVLQALRHVLAADGYQPNRKVNTIIRELSRRAHQRQEEK